MGPAYWVLGRGATTETGRATKGPRVRSAEPRVDDAKPALRRAHTSDTQAFSFRYFGCRHHPPPGAEAVPFPDGSKEKRLLGLVESPRAEVAVLVARRATARFEREQPRCTPSRWQTRVRSQRGASSVMAQTVRWRGREGEPRREDQADGSKTWPKKSHTPVARSRIKNKNGRSSATVWSGVGADVSTITTAVAAAASVPFSSTATKVLW